MITPGYIQKMARYNRWQNDSIYAAADSLSDGDRRLDRGGFFKSVHATLSHIRWADQIWMSRLGGWDAPDVGIKDSVSAYDDWTALKAARVEADANLIEWSNDVSQPEIEGDLSWYSGAVGRDLTRPRWVCILQVFNHQTHHRGQVHAMLTAAGAKPDDTDLPFMPEAYE
ncbi:MAG: DinB family protein [Pseudomonadota bacterium]